MVEISDDLLCLFNARIEEGDGGYVFEVPARELDRGELEPDGVYRIAVFREAGAGAAQETTVARADREARPRPPVSEGDVREVEIEDIGEQGDGIARVERGYVIIVPGAEVGERVTVQITTVAQNYAIGEVVEDRR